MSPPSLAASPKSKRRKFGPHSFSTGVISSAFNSTGIEWLLRNMDVTTLVVAGVATDMCVETTARDAADRGFDVIVVEDATMTYYEHHHRAALSGFARVFGQV